MFNVKTDGKKFFSGFFKKEEFFIQKKEKTFIGKRKILTEVYEENFKMNEKNNHLFYGYPTVIDNDGNISPLFFTEVFIEDSEKYFKLTKIDAEPTFNHYLLKRFGLKDEEISKFVEELNEEKGFPDKIKKITALLNIESEEITSELHKSDLLIKVQTRILNNAILYIGEQSGFVSGLLKELNKLKKYGKKNKAVDLDYIFKYKNKEENQNTAMVRSGLLEIFPMNIFQEKSVINSVTNDLTVVTGPPGTGKSQVVLNIIANAVYQNKTVLFASKNNKAVNVVQEKFNQIFPYNPVIRMGKKSYRDQAFKKIDDLLQGVKSIDFSKHEENMKYDLEKLNNEIEEINKTILLISNLNNEIDNHFNEIDNLLQELPNEFYHFSKHNEFREINALALKNDIEKLKNFDKGLITVIIKLLFKNYHNKKLLQFYNKYFNLLSSDFKDFVNSHITLDKSSIIQFFEWILSLIEINYTRKKIVIDKKTLENYPSINDLKKKSIDLHEKRVELSRNILYVHWFSKIKLMEISEENHIYRFFDASEKLESSYHEADIWKQLVDDKEHHFKEILNYFPIWAVTNLSVKSSIPFLKDVFDILIIDEASQCDIPSALPLIYRAKNIVIIGDPKQLKHISLLKAITDKKLSTSYQIDKLYQDLSYTKNSLYEAAERCLKENNKLPILLSDHYRSHDDIINFSNEFFYDNKLCILTNEDNLLPAEYFGKRLIWYDFKGETIPSKSPFNIQEGKNVINYLLRIQRIIEQNNITDIELGVVTLFRSQMELIESEIEKNNKLNNLNITVGTAHRFQGDEKDIMVFSPAISKGIKRSTIHWVNTTSQLLNVAITRAKSMLIVVGDKDKCCESKGILSDLVNYAIDKGEKEIIFDSNIEEIFYNKLMEFNIKVKPQFWVNIKGKKDYRLDFAYFINGKKFDIEVDGDKAHSLRVDYDNLRDLHLRMDGWNIRRYSADDISNNLDEVIEEIKRIY